MPESDSTPLQIDLRRHLRECDEDRDLTRLICEIAVDSSPCRSSLSSRLPARVTNPST